MRILLCTLDKNVLILNLTYIQKKGQLMQEGKSFGHFHDVAPDVVQCMAETQQRDQDILAALIGVLDLAREGRTEKKHLVGLMDLKGYQYAVYGS